MGNMNYPLSYPFHGQLAPTTLCSLCILLPQVACFTCAVAYILKRGGVRANQFMNVRHISTNASTGVQGHRPGFGGEVPTPPPPILGSGNTKKHVLEVNWTVISGYLPL